MKFSSHIAAITQSIKWRVFFYYTLLHLLVISLLIAGFHTYEKQSRIRSRTSEMQELAMRYMPLFFAPGHQGPPNGRGPAPPPPPRIDTRQLKEDVESMEHNGFFLAAIDHDAVVKFRSPTWPTSLNAPPIPEGKPSSITEMPGWILYSHQTAQQDRVIIGTSSVALEQEVRHLTVVAGAIGAAITVITSLVGMLILRFSLKPISMISESATRIAEGDFSERIDTGSQRSELGQLAVVLNKTFSRLEAAVQRQVQFTADASHELRTPVAAILADCQYSLKRERPPERYLETIEVCHESAQHMKSLIESLGALAAFDSKDALLNPTPIQLEDVLLQARQITEPLAALRSIALEVDLQPVQLIADERQLSQAVINLLANAVRFNRPNGTVSLKCWTEPTMACIEVADTGIGVPHELQDHIFERFFRVDPSRSNKSGGSGLGLAITRTIVEAHGGNIHLTSELGKGSRFVIRIPLRPVLLD
ncbi:HAMP domain-containing histidine kinase [Luteolibacter pohnpeiensis]|uniref:histidine kinase n=1 Tax=Luteolibacter pohnpeiensis TaxID=454153 RepID=A0A934S7Q9_9BACT|nr:HAMP domain-containing sensor histidine kinase [Luteolibacter pohnpeiensis]MBK1881247.1 HAMP domain-containing histidine kinase [Luteolibacter pohnpeiensis]